MTRSSSFVLASALALACSGPATPHGGYDDAEQVVVALRSCVPSWAALTARASFGATSITTLQLAPSSVGMTVDEVDCVLAAGSDCTEVRACFGMELFSDDRCAAPGPPACEGNTVVSCVIDATGALLPPARFRWDCGTGICNPSVPRCDPPTCTGLAICQGDRIIGDCGPAPVVTRCDPGTTCIANGSSATCVGAGPACTRTQCAGETLTLCDPSNLRVRGTLDCSAIDSHCIEDSAGARCVPRGNACTPSTPVSCAGDAIVYCGPGNDLRRYDCRAHGFGTCFQGDTTFPPDIRCIPDVGRVF